MSQASLLPTANRLSLEGLPYEVQLQILEEFDTKESLLNYIIACPVASSLWRRYRRRIILGFSKRLTKDAIRTSVILHHLLAHPRAVVNATKGEIASLAQFFTTIDGLSDNVLASLYWLWRRHDGLVHDALSQPWLHPVWRKHIEVTYSAKMWKWWRQSTAATTQSGWDGVLAELPGRLYNGLFHLNLHLHLGSSIFWIPFWNEQPSGMTQAGWAELVGLRGVNPNDRRLDMRQGPGVDMLLVATALDYNRMWAYNKIVDLYRFESHKHAHRDHRDEAGLDGGRLLGKKTDIFQDLESMMRLARRSRHTVPRYVVQHSAEIEFNGSQWDYQEESALAFFDGIQSSWKICLASYYGPGMVNPIPFSPNSYGGIAAPTLQRGYEDALTRCVKIREHRVKEKQYSEAPETISVRLLARESTDVLMATKEIRQSMV